MARVLTVVLAVGIGCGQVNGGGGGGGDDGGGGGDDSTGPGGDAGNGGFAVSPPMLDFGEVSAATPQVVRTLTITNTTATATALGVALTGADAASFETTANTCQPVAAGGTCTIDVALTAGRLGDYAATVTIAGSGLAVPLAGHAVAAQLAISPNNDDFGDLGLAGTTTRQYTVTNAGQAMLPAPVPAIAGGAAFTVAPGTCNVALAAGESCRFSIAFKPTALGAQTATATAVAGPLVAQAAVRGRGTAQLSAIRLGSGGGDITGAGLACGGTCTATVATASVSVAIAASAGSSFAGWGGAAAGCGASSPCTVAIGAATVSISATFDDLPTLDLEVFNSDSDGSVRVDSPATTCTGSCSYDYAAPTTTTLHPVFSHSTCTEFTGWSGACSGTGNCTITVGSNVGVFAGFSRERDCDPQ